MVKKFWLQHVQKRLLLSVFFICGIVASIIGLVWLLFCIVFAPNGRHPMSIAIGFDQLVNAATGGNEDETISSRAARERNEGKRWACILCKFLDKLDKNHCTNSLGG